MSRSRSMGLQQSSMSYPAVTYRQNQCLKRWRRGSESNRRRRLCRPLHDHSATPPGVAAGAVAQTEQTKRESAVLSPSLGKLERERSLELPTSTLARLRSTN